METLSALLVLCEGNHQAPVDSPHTGPVMRRFAIFFVVSLTIYWTNGDATVIMIKPSEVCGEISDTPRDHRRSNVVKHKAASLTNTNRRWFVALSCRDKIRKWPLAFYIHGPHICLSINNLTLPIWQMTFGSTPIEAKPSASTVLPIKLDMLSSEFLQISVASQNLADQLTTSNIAEEISSCDNASVSFCEKRIPPPTHSVHVSLNLCWNISALAKVL